MRTNYRALIRGQIAANLRPHPNPDPYGAVPLAARLYPGKLFVMGLSRGLVVAPRDAWRAAYADARKNRRSLRNS